MAREARRIRRPGGNGTTGGESSDDRVSAAFPTEVVALDTLKRHPRNYRSHPDDQLEHIASSIREHGLYRNVVIARDGTILAGHGVVEAVRQKIGMTDLPVVRIDVDPLDPRALKILTGDNEIGHLAEVDDRALTEILREIAQSGEGNLNGTGFDEKMLANLVMVTRPASEIKDINEAEHWVGLPSYQEQGDTPTLKLIINFDSEEARTELLEKIGSPAMSKKDGQTWSTWWPPRERNDLASVRFEG